MNRSRGIVNEDFKSKELMKYINLLYDIMDVKEYYNKMGGTDSTVSDSIVDLEDCIYEQHTHILKGEMPKMLKNPIFQPYMQKLLNEYKKMQLIDENEAKMFEGEMKLQQFEEEMKNIKKKKVRGIVGMMKIGTGLDKMKIAKLFDYYSAAGDDPTDIMLLMKMNPGEAADVATEKDSLLLLQKRQELQIELTRLRNDMHLDDEKRFLVEKFGSELNLNLSSLPMPKSTTKQVTIKDPKDKAIEESSPTSKMIAAAKDDKKKQELAKDRKMRMAEKKEKAAEQEEKKKYLASKSKDKKEKDDKKDKKDKDSKKDKDDKKDKKKDDKKSVDKKKDEKKSVDKKDKKKDDKKSVDKKDKKKDDKKSVDKKDKKKDDKKSVDKKDKKKDDKKSSDKKSKKK